MCLDQGLELIEKNSGIEFDLAGLLRMDTATQIKTLGEGVGNGIITPNEARQRINLPPLAGGDTAYLQMQNFSLEALSKRDEKEDPFLSVNSKGPGGGS